MVLFTQLTPDRLQHHVVVGEYADIRSDVDGLLGDLSGGQLGVLNEGAGGGKGIIAAGADGHHTAVGINDFAGTGNDQHLLSVGHDQQRLQLAHGAVAAPLLCQSYGCTGQIAGMLLQLALKKIAQGKGIGHGAGKAHQHLSVVNAAHLVGGGLHDHTFALGHLSVTGQSRNSVAAHGHDGRSVKSHSLSSCTWGL